MQENTIYPTEILPQENYRIHLDIDNLLQVYELVMVRRTLTNPILVDEAGAMVLPEDCVTESSPFFYSMNLLGGNFCVKKHLSFRQMGDGTNDWDGLTYFSNEQLEGKWEVTNNSYPIYYLVKDFHKVEFPYKRNFQKEKDFQAYIKSIRAKNAYNVWRQNVPVDLKFVITINHEPTNMNYWHVTLNPHDYSDQQPPMKDGSQAWKKNIRCVLIDLLRRKFVKVENCSYIIDETFYKTT